MIAVSSYITPSAEQFAYKFGLQNNKLPVIIWDISANCEPLRWNKTDY